MYTRLIDVFRRVPVPVECGDSSRAELIYNAIGDFRFGRLETYSDLKVRSPTWLVICDSSNSMNIKYLSHLRFSFRLQK